MKILIVKLSSIGDIIHTLPVLAAVKRALPDAEISWVVEKNSAELLRENPLLTRLIEVDTKSLRRKEVSGETLLAAREQSRELRAAKFDVALDFQGLFKSAMIAKLSRAPRRCGFARAALREPASRFLLTETFEVAPQTHIIVKNLMLARDALNISVPDRDFEFPIFTNEEHRLEASKIAALAGGSFAVLNPAANWTTKMWNAEKFGALADKLWEENRLASIVTVAPAEKLLGERVLSAGKSGKIILTTPTLKGFYELARRAAVVVGSDTGPTHLAIAANASVVGIFGPTEWWRNGSPREQDVCVERADIDCRADCHRRACNNWVCLDISVDDVLKAVQKRLGKNEKSLNPLTPVLRQNISGENIFAKNL